MQTDDEKSAKAVAMGMRVHDERGQNVGGGGHGMPWHAEDADVKTSLLAGFNNGRRRTGE